MRCLDEPSGNLRGSITDASPIIQLHSALHRLTVNDVLLESATMGDPSAMRRRVMVRS